MNADTINVAAAVERPSIKTFSVRLRLTSFISRVTRYRYSGTVDPAENRLTESLAAVLDTVPELGAVIPQWLGVVESSGRPIIRTQRLTQSGGFIDLELRFGAVTRPDLLMWVEVKHGSVPTLFQLERYRQDIALEGAATTRLVLLLPDGTHMPAGAGPSLVSVVRWQELHRRLRRWHHRHARVLAPESSWLVSELIAFLQEEGVADPGSITSLDVVAAGRAAQAFSLMQRLREGAEAVIGEKWARVAGENRANGRFYRHYRPADLAAEEWSARWPVGWFEWRLTSDRNLVAPVGGLVYGAGYTRPKRQLPTGEAEVGWVAGLEAVGYDVVVDDQWRLYRHLRLDAVLAGDTLEAQAQVVADWVLDTLEQLNQEPIP